MRLGHDAAEWLLGSEGSTRSAALLRIGIVVVAWARYGRELMLHQNLSDGRWVLSLAFFVTSVLTLVGFRTRISTFAFGVTVLTTYGYLASLAGIFEGGRMWGQHPYLMGVSLCLLALTPCGHSLSLDRWLALDTQRGPPDEFGPLWGLRLIGLQVSVMYFWAAVDKSTWVFLSGARLEHVVTFYYTYSRPEFFGATAIFAMAAWAVVIFEYVLVVGLWIPKLRAWLIPAGLVFHAVIYVTLSVQTFSALMFVLYLVYVPPETVHRGIDRLLARRERG